MLDKIPNEEDLTHLIGTSLYEVWINLCAVIDEKYDMEHLWNKGGKAWTYEYKYRRGGKTLCTLYVKLDSVGFMLIFGKAEREKFETDRQNYCEEIQQVYDAAKIYHDGKWVMFEPVDMSLFPDFMNLLQLKRKPNKKSNIK